ncbi:MAG: regulatory protein RecX [Ignavibacteria bacterium]
MDNEFAFGVFRETVYKFGLRLNDIVDQKQIDEILEFDEYIKAQKIVYKFLSYSNYTTNEIVQKLRKKKIKSSVIEKIIDNIVKQGLVNDYEYVKSYIESRKLNKPIGTKLLRLKLKNKGINSETINTQIGELYPPEVEKVVAEKVLDRYIKMLKEKDARKKREKCFRHLLSKGFDYDLIIDVLRNKFENDFDKV